MAPRRAFLLTFCLALLAWAGVRGVFAAEASASLQRYLADLYLGDTLEDAQKVYRPAREWPAVVEPKAEVTRLRLEPRAVKQMPRSIATMWLGLRRRRLVEIQLIYDAKYTKQKPVEALVDDLALIYGEPQYTSGKYWWADGKTVLRAFYAEVPVPKGGTQAVELRTSLQLLDASLFKRED